MDTHAPFEPRFLTAVLWLCAAGALWLLLSPAAFQRRALARRVSLLEEEIASERRETAGLRRWRNGLANDPSVIEREARKLGYGLPDERVYPLPADTVIRRAEAEWERRREAHAEVSNLALKAIVRRTVTPVLMLLLGGFTAFLFYHDLRIEEPSPPPPPAPRPNEETD